MQPKYTQKDFLEKAKAVHGNKYDYTNSVHVDSSTKIKILCPIHGIFEQLPQTHWCGKGCIKCGFEKNRTWTKERDDFLRENYREKRGKFCAKELDVSVGALFKRAEELGIKIFKPRQERHANLPNRIWSSVVKHSEGRKGEFNVDKDYIWSVFEQQGGKCALTGWNIDFKDETKIGRASVDRINSKLNYSRGNIQIVERHANALKSDFDEKFLYKMCEAIVGYRAHDLRASAIIATEKPRVWSLSREEAKNLYDSVNNP